MIALLLIATIEIQLPPCRPDWLEARSLVALLAAETSTPAFSQLALSIPDCEAAPERMQVTVTSSIGSATRVVSFTDIPRQARLRALAVSIGELDIEPILEPIPEPIPKAAPAAPPALETQPMEEPVVRSSSLFVTAGGRVHPATETTAFHLQAGLTRRLWIEGAFSLDGALELGFAAATRQLPQGSVRLILLSAGAGAEAKWRFAPFSLGIGPRFAVGWGHASGSPESDSVTSRSAHALIGTASLAASLRWALLETLGLQLTVEGGLMLKGLEATVDGESRAGWRGGFAGATAGVYFDL